MSTRTRLVRSSASWGHRHRRSGRMLHGYARGTQLLPACSAAGVARLGHVTDSQPVITSHAADHRAKGNGPLFPEGLRSGPRLDRTRGPLSCLLHEERATRGGLLLPNPVYERRSRSLCNRRNLMGTQSSCQAQHLTPCQRSANIWFNIGLATRWRLAESAMCEA
jgi:hypothetical protein